MKLQLVSALYLEFLERRSPQFRFELAAAARLLVLAGGIHKRPARRGVRGLAGSGGLAGGMRAGTDTALARAVAGSE